MEFADDEIGGPLDMRIPIIRQAVENEKIRRRIEAARQWKREHYCDYIPDDVDIDELAPGTGDLNIDTYVKQGSDRMTREQARESKRRFQTKYRDKNGGIIGLQLTDRLIIRVAFDGRFVGRFLTYADAAAVYDAMAIEAHGEYAVTNDPEAVARADVELTKRRDATGIHTNLRTRRRPIDIKAEIA